MTPLRAVPSPRPLLADAEGPLFLLGDTAWELVHRLDRGGIETYLAARAGQGFRAVWFVLLAEFDGLTEPNREGHLPLVDLDPRSPNPAYFGLVDHAVARCAAHGLYAAILPTWGDKVTAPWGAGPRVFTSEDPGAAGAYGEWVGARYGGFDHVLWVLGGDRPAVPFGIGNPGLEANARAAGFAPGDDWRPIWRALSAGLDRGAGRHLLTTYHPQGGEHRTSRDLDGEPWLDLHAMQTGHGGGRDAPGWRWVAEDLALSRPRPTLDAEPNYEDHPVDPWPVWDPATGYFDDGDARKAAWRTAFAGAAGVTYGHHSVWQFASDRHEWVNHARMDWREALTRPGAASMGHLRRFLEARDFAAMRPVGGSGEGAAYRAEMRGEGRAWVYAPSDAPFAVAFDAARAEWFDPRTGGTTPAPIGATYAPPGPGDWVLALES